MSEQYEKDKKALDEKLYQEYKQTLDARLADIARGGGNSMTPEQYVKRQQALTPGRILDSMDLIQDTIELIREEVSLFDNFWSTLDRHHRTIIILALAGMVFCAEMTQVEKMEGEHTDG